MSITNFYCPNTKKLYLITIPISDTDHLVVGDFISHSPSWGYPKMDSRGDDVEEWMIENNLILNNHDDEPSYYSRSRRSTSTPDLAMATENIQRKVIREVTKQLGGSDHKPITLTRKQMPIPDNKQKSASWTARKQTGTSIQDLPSKTSQQQFRQNAKQFSLQIHTTREKTQLPTILE